MEYILKAIVFLYGIIAGSFLNVCIYRIPNKENIISKRSHCMSCGNVLKWYELIPLLSFLIQGGKCRHCHTKLSRQYPLVELANGLLWLWLFRIHGLSMECALFCLCTSVLLVIAFIDFRTFEIPFGCNVAIGILGVVRLLFNLWDWQNYVTGFFAVSGFFYIIYIVTKGRGIGGGDIKLMAAAGLLLGWKEIIFAMAVGSIVGAVLHTIRMKISKEDRVLAFGPYLAFGILTAMLCGRQFTDWYAALFV